MLHGLVRRYGLAERFGAIRVVDLPVLGLEDHDVLLDRLYAQAAEAVATRDADVIVLGCTGMLGVARALQDRLEADGTFVPADRPDRRGDRVAGDRRPPRRPAEARAHLYAPAAEGPGLASRLTNGRSDRGAADAPQRGHRNSSTGS